MIGFIFATISAIGYSLNQIFNKKLILNGLNNWNALLISNFFLTISAFIIAILFGSFDLYKYELKYIIIIIFGGIIGFFAEFFLFKSFKYLKVGESITIANTYPFVILLLTFFFENKFISIKKIGIMFLIFFASFELIKFRNKFKLSITILYPIITSISWGIYGYILYLLNKMFNIYYIIFFLELVIFISTTIFIKISKNKISKKIFKSKIILFGFIIGITTEIGTLFYGLATNYINPAIVSSIGSTQIALTFLFSLFLLNEKINLKQIISMLLILIGLILFYIV